MFIKIFWWLVIFFLCTNSDRLFSSGTDPLAGSILWLTGCTAVAGRSSACTRARSSVSWHWPTSCWKLHDGESVFWIHSDRDVVSILWPSSVWNCLFVNTKHLIYTSVCVIVTQTIPQWQQGHKLNLNCIFLNYKYTKNIKTDTITVLVTKHHTSVNTFIKPPFKASVINY